MKFRADEIVSVLREEIAQFHRDVDVSKTGRVLEVGDGIAQVFGLADAMTGEMIEFQSGAIGQVFNLEENSLGAVLYTDADTVRAGMEVRATGKLLSVPVSEAMLGRVIDPLGTPLDGGKPLEIETLRPVEVPAPGIAERQPVTEALQTGIKAIDALTPIGRGQRELIIGDRKTGKTALAIDTILNQIGGDVVCIYVAIGQKETTIAGLVKTLQDLGAMDHTIIVSAASSDPASLQYIAPYSGCTLAEHFMLQGRDTLIVYDDLSKQAAAYRQISLLLRRPPGREAYPGDVFYLHSRLLERACKLAEKYVLAPPDAEIDETARSGKVYVGPLGKKQALTDLKEDDGNEKNLELHTLPDSGGSMTALPICETQEGEVAAYIPTNLISITDGQIYLEPKLFFAGVRPAVNVGISVSRVGYKAALSAMKTVAASLRLDLAAYRELESFSQLGMDLDASSKQRLQRGQRMIRLLTQPQYQPMDVIDQVLSLAVGAGGALDELSVDEVAEFEAALLQYIREEHAEFREELAAEGIFGDDRRKRLNFIAEEFKTSGWEDHKKAQRRARREKQQTE